MGIVAAPRMKVTGKSHTGKIALRPNGMQKQKMTIAIVITDRAANPDVFTPVNVLSFVSMM
jgi:hypothetical protein